MPRVKRGKGHLKRRKNILKASKGYRHGRKNLIKLAKVAILKAGKYAYRDRKNKKRTSRSLSQIKINAAVRIYGLSYSQFMGKLKKNKIELDRKILSDLAENNNAVFAKLVEQVKSMKA